MFNARAGNVVGLFQGTIVVHAVLGNDEKGNSLDSFGIAVHSGQHGMDNVGFAVMIPCGNKAFLACDPVIPVINLFRPGDNASKVAPGSGLGEAHGSSPFKTKELFQIEVFLLLGAKELDEQGCAVGKSHILAHSHVAGYKGLIRRSKQGKRQSLSAGLRLFNGRHPSLLGILLQGSVERWRQADLPLFPLGSDAISVNVSGCQIVLGKLHRLIQNHVELLLRKMAVLFRCDQCCNTELLIEHEIYVSSIYYTACHYYLLLIFEFRYTFFHEGCCALFLVFTCVTYAEHLAFKLHSRVKIHGRSFADGADSCPDSDTAF